MAKFTARQAAKALTDVETTFGAASVRTDNPDLREGEFCSTICAMI